MCQDWKIIQVLDLPTKMWKIKFRKVCSIFHVTRYILVKILTHNLLNLKNTCPANSIELGHNALMCRHILVTKPKHFWFQQDKGYL